MKFVKSIFFTVIISACLFVSSFDSLGSGLTQATDPTAVAYRELDSDSIEALRSIFDVDYYKAHNPELVDIIGDDYEALFEHFYLLGVFEGRTCNADFDPSAYAAAYSDLRDLFGNDIVKYYIHYSAFKDTDTRPITTLAKCAEEGITVTSLVDSSVVITPSVFLVSQILGTEDYGVIGKALNASNEHHHLDASNIVVSDTAVNTEFLTAAGLEYVGSVEVGSYVGDDGNTYAKATLFIYFARGDSGFAAYLSDDVQKSMQSDENLTLVYSTEDYVAKARLLDEIMYNITIFIMDVDYQNYSINTAQIDGENHEVFCTYEQEGDIPEDGLMFFHGIYDERENYSHLYYNADASEELTFNEVQQIVGIYNSETHEITPLTEEQLARYNERPAGPVNGTFEMTMGYDAEGDISTVYDVGIDIVEGDDNSVTTTVGLSNKANEFGYVVTYTVSNEDISQEEAQQNNAPQVNVQQENGQQENSTQDNSQQVNEQQENAQQENQTGN